MPFVPVSHLSACVSHYFLVPPSLSSISTSLCLRDTNDFLNLIDTMTFMLQKHKTKKEVMEEIILKSKFFKVGIVICVMAFRMWPQLFLIFINLVPGFSLFFPFTRHKKQKTRKKMNS